MIDDPMKHCENGTMRVNHASKPGARIAAEENRMRSNGVSSEERNQIQTIFYGNPRNAAYQWTTKGFGPT